MDTRWAGLQAEVTETQVLVEAALGLVSLAWHLAGDKVRLVNWTEEHCPRSSVNKTKRN